MSDTPIAAPVELNPPTTAMTCSNCRCQLVERYFQANGMTLCERCLASVQQFIDGQGSSVGRFFKAAAFGFGAALVGALGYGLLMKFTGMNLAIATIAVGWFVGKAVREGSGNRGGWRYGLLAVALTYLAISVSFTGTALTETAGADPIGVLVSIALSPILSGINSPLSLLITGFGLWQAWKMNRAAEIQITGPYPVGSSPAV